MSKLDIVNNVSRTFHKVGFKFKKHSPEILVVAGVAGTVVATVLACKATLKVNEEVLEPAKKSIKKIEDAKAKGTTEAGKTYTEEDAVNDMKITYIQTGVKVAKHYAVPVIVGGVSIAAILGGHHILRKRNIATAAAFAAMEKSFKEYRGRVVERFGKDLDKELRYNIKTKEVEETVVNEDGTEAVVKKTVEVADDPNNYGDFSRFFDAACAGWDPNPQVSLMFLRQQQNYANEKLKRQGYLFLNDVYKMLGIPVCPMGQVIGWIYDEKNPIGDNYVDFGIYDIHKEKCRDFVNGYEQVILLDFNHDGNIMDKI